MTKISIENMGSLQYRVLIEMLRGSSCWFPKELHDAEEYHIKGATRKSSDVLSEVIAKAWEKNGLGLIDVDYYIIHIHGSFCLLIIPYEFSAERSQRFVKDLKLVAEQYGIFEEVFEGIGELKLPYDFGDRWICSSNRSLERAVELLRNSVFIIDGE